MKVILQVVQGQDPGFEIEITPGESQRVGKDNGLSDVSFPLDPSMSLVHCVVGCDDAGGFVRDLNSMAGTWVNDQRVSQARLKDGDKLRAGDTIFVARVVWDAGGAQATTIAPAETAFNAEEPKAEDASTAKKRLLAFLRQEPLPIYALLDAARSIRIVRMMAETGAEAQSLLETQANPELHDVAPYLVQFPKLSPLLEKVIDKGWSESWGVFFTSAETFSQLRLHFRELLMVDTEDGKSVYFRYYDPRILRVYLPTCNSEETRQFFGPVDRFIVEKDEETALYFLPGPKPKLVTVSLNPQPLQEAS